MTTTMEMELQHARTIVEHAGGIWIGLQDSFLADFPIVCFRSPDNFHMLSLPFDEFFTVNAVQEKLKHTL